MAETSAYFSDSFDGIDFSDVRVQVFFCIVVLALCVLILAVFLIFKLFIPKSKAHDIETINKAIRRLKRLIIFEKVVLSVTVLVAAIMAILHFTSVVNLFRPPFIWVALGCLAILPIFIVAVFGLNSSATSPNKMKLEDLQRRKQNILNSR